MKKKALCMLLCGLFIFFVSACKKDETVWSDEKTAINPVMSKKPQKVADGFAIKAAVVYDSKQPDGHWEDTVLYLEQSLLVNLEVTLLDVQNQCLFSDYDVIYPDISLIRSEKSQNIYDEIITFTKNGGYTFLENEFCEYIDKDFTGISELIKLDEYPSLLEFADMGDDLLELQNIVSDFSSLYTSFADFKKLSGYDYGYAMKVDTATPLVMFEKNALYAINYYGYGGVFITNPLLPNHFSLSGFSMEIKNENQTAFSSTTAGCNQLLINKFAAYAAKQKYGYSINRVFGSLGSPSMAWELHYEEITGIANNSMQIFDKLCREYLQIPSFTLIRNSYTWFLRAESVTYYQNCSLNEKNEANEANEMKFSMNFSENAYSSGTHIDSAGDWLALTKIENAGSYFVDYPQYDQRAYPCLGDFNNDGIADIICGSSDGKLYLYDGIDFDKRFKTSEAKILTDTLGNPISSIGYSSPEVVDINNDGILDLISGASDGDIHWFMGNNDMQFTYQGVLIDTDIKGQSMPVSGDINGDGILDIVIGSNESILIAYYGHKDENGKISFTYSDMAGFSKLCATANMGKWLAPEIEDIDKDGDFDILVGTFDGYTAKLCNNENKFSFNGFIQTDEMNYKGNYNIKTGNNCIPRLYDIDKDGKNDLVCGSLEYGLAYPIDSEYFPFANKLKEQIEYANDNELYVGVHFYTNAYASSKREAYELKAHNDAMKYYGVSTENIGANQHTWYTSANSPYQSFLSIFDSGLKWQSGFSPSKSSFDSPQIAAENVVAMPFFLKRNGEKSILIQNNSVITYKGSEWTDISAEYGVPICVYYHCDFVYESDQNARESMQNLSEFQQKHGYNFVKEDQLMMASAAAYNLKALVTGDNVSVGKNINIMIAPEKKSADGILYNENFQSACGVEISFSDSTYISKISTDADVWYKKGNSLFVGLNKEVNVYYSDKMDTKTHLERVNLPSNITSDSKGAKISFLEGGMMQVVVSSDANTNSEGWTVTKQGEKTIFTKYGKPDILNIEYESVKKIASHFHPI